MAYYERDPWGEERADWRAASIAGQVHNMLSGRRRGRPLRDFLVWRGPPEIMSGAKLAAFKALLRPYARPVPDDDANGRKPAGPPQG